MTELYRHLTDLRVERVEDYAYAKRNRREEEADDITVLEHLEVLALAQHYVDSACSKTCNVGNDVTYEEFKEVYYKAWEMGCKGVTTFRAAGKRFGILQTVEVASGRRRARWRAWRRKLETEENTNGATACFIDPTTGQRECS